MLVLVLVLIKISVKFKLGVDDLNLKTSSAEWRVSLQRWGLRIGLELRVDLELRMGLKAENLVRV